VAKLVDAADSKSAARKGVLVRFRSRALMPDQQSGFFMFKTHSCKGFQRF